MLLQFGYLFLANRSYYSGRKMFNVIYTNDNLHIKTLLLILFSNTVCSQYYMPNITLVSQMISKNRFNLTCVANGQSLESAITWVEPLSIYPPENEVSEYVPVRVNENNCDLDPESEECNKYWTVEKWQLQNSFLNQIGAVTDYRWEAFEILHTNGYLVFQQIGDFFNAQFKLHFSTRVKRDANIYLCDYNYPPSGNCYWIILGGWGGKETAIRKCRNGAIPNSFDKFPKEPCSTKRDSRQHGEILNENEWKHFTLERNFNNIVLWSLDTKEALINYTDYNGAITTPYLMVNSRGTPGLWKFHEYYYLYTEKDTSTYVGPRIYVQEMVFCISIFIAMCGHCQLTIQVQYENERGQDDIIHESTILPVEGSEWQEQRIQVKLPRPDIFVHLYIIPGSTGDVERQFWALDKFQICSVDEVRVLSKRHGNDEISCQAIRYPRWNAILTKTIKDNYLDVLETKCPSYTFGRSCIDCSKVFDTFCDKSTICSLKSDGSSVCACAPGYMGDNCADQCNKNYYGMNCQNECGFCQYLPCDYITGVCARKQCANGFIDDRCTIPPLPVLLHPPQLIEIKPTSVIVQLQNTSYKGLGQASYYKLRFKELNEGRWEESNVYYFTATDPIELNNLKVLTTYEIQAILITQDNDMYDKDYIVPRINVTTTCKFVERNDLTIQTFNTSISIIFKSAADSCKLEDYYIFQDDKPLPKPTTLVFNITNLRPVTYYDFFVKNSRSNGSLKLHVRTEEGAPGIVREVKTSGTPTGFILKWLPPNTPNGEIKYYNIYYQHLNYLACSTYKIKNSEYEKHFNVPDTSFVIQDLLPYSEYLVKITGHTVMPGVSSYHYVDTLSSEIPEENELPNIDKIDPRPTGATMFLSSVNCTFMKGPLEFYISTECNNPWCPKEATERSFKQNSNPLKFDLWGLFPYSNYTIKVEIGRMNGKRLTEVSKAATFNTKEWSPYPIKDITVHSKNETSAYIRFPPPYPPTGEISEYKAQYCYEEMGYFKRYPVCNDKIFKPIPCRLWKSLHCIAIYNLRENTRYSIKIQAKNNGTDYGQWRTVDTYTAQGVSDPPGNLSAFWDKYYNLTLSWTHPSVTNGALTKFVVKIKVNRKICYTHDIPVNEEDYNLMYNYTVIFNEKCLASDLIIEMNAFNIKQGQLILLQNVSSPPPMPSFKNVPNVEQVTNTTATIELSEVKDTKNSHVYVVVSSAETNLETESINEQLVEIFRKFEIPSNKHSWIAAEFDLTKEKLSRGTLTIGNNQIHSVNLTTHNGPLRANTSYDITIILVNAFKGAQRYKLYKVPITTTGSDITNESQAALFALLLLLAVPIILCFVLMRKKMITVNTEWLSVLKERDNSARNSNPDVIPLTQDMRSKPEKPPLPLNTQSKDKTSEGTSNELSVEVPNTFSKPVKIIEFEKYLKEAIASGELERQHQLFPRGQTKPWDYGLLPQNKSKNRYNNLIAYDHTRVKLKQINNDPYSDYINANYIEGYNNKKAYIATQGPKVATVNDFWRMIWQENVQYIVMLANVIEGGKKKTEQYWPNINETLEFGNIKVEYASSRVFADYEYRSFSVYCENIERKLEQLHFTSWPDHGVPLYSQSLVPFLRKLLTIPQGKAPVVVHCSAGVGRTGTVILCDLCLRMAAREGIVDVLKHQHNLREQRANLVDNVEQYKLAHLVLLDCLVAPNTSLVCDENMETPVLNLLKSKKYKDQMQYLYDTDWQDEAMRPPIEITPKAEWKNRNRFQEIVPAGYGRVYLSRYPTTDEHSDYINAVEVDGFRSPQLFIATQQPLPNTVSDFWRMIDEKQATVIVSLNEIDPTNTTTSVFWPTEAATEMQPVPYLTIKFYDECDNEYYNLITLYLYNNKNKKSEKHKIYLLAFKQWPHDKVLPNSEEGLIKLWEETERVSRNSAPIVVICFDGAKACGLFLAASFVIEKMKLEQECDVCLAVRAVRHNRKQFVTEADQFAFLYQLALSYLSCFELYSNFSSITKK